MLKVEWNENPAKTILTYIYVYLVQVLYFLHLSLLRASLFCKEIMGLLEESRLGLIWHH